MSKRNLIDSIEVKSPCSEDWEKMSGSEKVRFCGHCAFEVNDISALTRKQALRLVGGSQGRICVRYVKNPATNQPVFADRLYRITRRAGIAAGVLGATLVVSTLAYGQGSNPVSLTQKAEVSQAETADKNKFESGTASVTGTITDAKGMVIPNATVTISKSGYTQTAATDENGFYKFENISAGKYMVQAASAGYMVSAAEIDVSADREKVASLALEVLEVDNTTIMVMGSMAMIEYSTPLFTAVSGGEPEEVKNLLVRGENVNAKDENYSRITPLFLAVENGSAEVAETLLNFGAKINARDDNRQTPLMRLDEDANAELVNLLIKHGARVNLFDKEGNTPLIFAARSVNAEVLQILLRHNANVNARNSAGRTALMEAADADNLENVRALLAAGADANLKDKDGETALDLTSDDEIETLLIEFGADAPNDSQ